MVTYDRFPICASCGSVAPANFLNSAVHYYARWRTDYARSEVQKI